MSIRCVTLWLVLMLLPVTVLAQCPIGVQETVVLYLNGVDTTEWSARLSKNRIEEEVSKVPSILTDCIKYDYVYNTNEKLFGDLIEAGLQKAKEQNLSASDFWRWFFRMAEFPLANLFLDLLPVFYGDTSLSIDLGLFVLGDQVEEHLAKIREYLAQGKRVIIVSHSQGNLYANEEWNQLTNAEKNAVDIVAVATPTDHVADNGPYTTLVEDKVAELFFPQALAANVANDESCPNDWTCHGFKESYMKGDHSRTRIVEQIISFLPVVQEELCRIEGIIIYGEDNSIVSGAKITLWNYWSGDPVFQTVSNSNGRYCIGNVADDDYAIDVNYDHQHFGIGEAHLPGTTEPLIIDIILYAPL